MIVGCYSMHLYCEVLADGCHCVASAKHAGGPGEFTGQNERECRRRARKYGWQVDKRKIKCPACRAAMTNTAQENER